MKTTGAQDVAAQRYASLNRRHFLRGVSACLALPALESILPVKLFATGADAVSQVASTSAPLRMAYLYFPNGAIQDNWWPQGSGEEFEFSRTMQPLEPLKHHLQVLGGL